MPEASMDKYDFPSAGEYQIRCSRKAPNMETISEAQVMYQMANGEFR
jgi:hypothetical protein